MACRRRVCGYRLSWTHRRGSGLGTSSTLVVAIIGVFAEMLRLPLGGATIWRIPEHGIERERSAHGRRTAGSIRSRLRRVSTIWNSSGVPKVIVNPLRVKQQYLFELENNLLLYYTSTSRESAKIIEKQSQNVVDKKSKSIEAMHQLKRQAQLMKEALLKGRIHEIGEILDFGFRQKQQMADGISNDLIDELYEQAKKAGATGGKGYRGPAAAGFMTFYCPGISKYEVMEALAPFGGYCKPYQFTDHGLTAWTI